jgi:DNA-binding response OmpR family regulator
VALLRSVRDVTAISPVTPDGEAAVTSGGSAGETPDHGDRDARDAGRKVRILVVDDSIDAADSMCAVLRLFGNDADMAHDGESAIALVKTYQPDLVLMDLSLPTLSGLDAGRQVREALAPQPVVVVAMTGWGRDEDRAMSLQYGFNGHLTKPVDFQQLKTIIRDVAVARGIAAPQQLP